MKEKPCPVCSHHRFLRHLNCKDYTVSDEMFEIVRCDNCNLLITSPQPGNLDRYYQAVDYVSHTNKANSVINALYKLARHFTLKQKVKLITKYSNGRKTLLDIGCGAGSFLHACRREHWKVQGIEPNQIASHQARQGGITIHPSLDSPIKNKFSVITLWHVLEHLPDLNKSIEQIRQLSDKDGTIFIAVPNYQSYDATYYRQYWAGYDVPRHLWHFSQNTMHDLIQRHGMQIISVEPMTLDSYYVSLLSEKYKHTVFPLSFMKAFIAGMKSNIKARKTKNYSSLIYIIKK